MPLAEVQVIEVFKALADPNRLQIFELLLVSDRTNSELMEATGLRQNLLSHHLNILTACGLVQTHRSIGDARRHYYSPRLEIARACREWWEHRSPAGIPAQPLHPRHKVLFLCLRNSVRSFVAEGLARHHAAHLLDVYSAGLEVGDPGTLEIGRQVLMERGVPPFEFTMKTFDLVAGVGFDSVITVCDVVHESDLPPQLAGYTFIHWSLKDPLEVAADEAGRLAATRALCDDVTVRLAFFVQRVVQDSIAGP